MTDSAHDIAADLDRGGRKLKPARQAELDRLADQCPCAICRTDQAPRTGPRVSLAIQAEVGESLMGLLCRVARRDHLSSINPIIMTSTPLVHAYVNLALRDDVDFGRLAHAARLPRHEVETRRYRPIQITDTLPGVAFHGATVPRYDLVARPRRLALSWLSASRLHSALAHHGLVTHCPIGGDLLVDRCPGCNAALGWATIEIERCGGCGADLRGHNPEYVGEERMHATRLMADLVHPDPVRHAAAAANLPEPLRGLDRGAAFELGWRMGCVLEKHGLDARNEAKRLPVETRLAILAAGSAALTAWPESLHSALAGRRLSCVDADVALATATRGITAKRNVWPSVKAAVDAAAPALVRSARAAVRAVMPSVANAAEMTRSLGVSEKTFGRIRAHASARPISDGGTIHRHQLFDPADFQHIGALLADGVALVAGANRIGIGHHGIEQLCSVGEITPIDDETVLAALKRRRIRRSSLDLLITRLEEKRSNSVADPIPIHRALMTIGGREKPWGPIIAAMLSGCLSFTLDLIRGDPLMNRVAIASADVGRLATMVFAPDPGRAFAFDPRINGRDAERLLNAEPTVFSRAVGSSETPKPVDGGFDRAAMVALSLHVISGSEILVRWGQGRKQRPAILNGPDRLVRLGHLGWCRAEVEMAMENQTAASEAA
ncbi:hypothetical protein [Sphingomonas bacterium]|uniref:hypothetical protein n=1 Tax=Sphingomonas bacterium TaxID=1895847 RepID=UPI001576C933|nr:hypothetical protein [Sphingomonas bacterium]